MNIRRLLLAIFLAFAMVGFGATAQDMAGDAGVDVAQHDTHGAYLTDSEGNALYAFVDETMEFDETQTMMEGVRDAAVSCTGDCLAAWPAFTSEGDISVAEGTEIQGDLLYAGSFDDRTNQVVFNGWPLFTFANDEQPGDVNGQGLEGFGGTWYLVAPDGTLIRGDQGM